jgi:hypothetical protein
MSMSSAPWTRNTREQTDDALLRQLRQAQLRGSQCAMECHKVPVAPAHCCTGVLRMQAVGCSFVARCSATHERTWPLSTVHSYSEYARNPWPTVTTAVMRTAIVPSATTGAAGGKRAGGVDVIAGLVIGTGTAASTSEEASFAVTWRWLVVGGTSLVMESRMVCVRVRIASRDRLVSR